MVLAVAVVIVVLVVEVVIVVLAVVVVIVVVIVHRIANANYLHDYTWHFVDNTSPATGHLCKHLCCYMPPLHLHIARPS